MNRVGITERGDASIDLSWESKLDSVDYAIVITKNPSIEFIKRALVNKDKIIIHVTCTGYGGTLLEPNVPPMEKVKERTAILIGAGFLASNIVLRVDPIIPTVKGIETACKVLELFKNTGIRRCRFSFIDMYSHVKERFRLKGLRLPFDGFSAPKYSQENFLVRIPEYKKYYEFESCAEGLEYDTACISKKDSDLLGIDDIKYSGLLNNRKGCKCSGNKVELLTEIKQCKHGCLYCYWKGYD